MIQQILALIGTTLAVVGSAYACFAVYAVLNGVRRISTYELPGQRVVSNACNEPTPVSVLKPLCGNEPSLYKNIRSFCIQSYPDFQIIFGVRDPEDPAIAIVRCLQTDFPELDIQLVIDS